MKRASAGWVAGLLCAAGAMLAASGCESLDQGIDILRENPELLGEEDTTKWVKGLEFARSVVSQIDTAEEIEIGQSLALRAFASFGKPYDDPALIGYVARVGKLVALQSDRPSLPYHFTVVVNEKPNALALPGGFVFISTGLLKELQSESELAAILGHEIAHVAERHGLEIGMRDQRISNLLDFAQELDEDVADYRQFIDLTYDKLATEGYDQQYEIKADLAGTRYARRVGYHPEGLLPFLQKSARSGLAFEVFKTHPDPAKRMRRIRRLLDGMGGYSSLPKLDGRYRREVLERLR